MRGNETYNLLSSGVGVRKKKAVANSASLPPALDDNDAAIKIRQLQGKVREGHKIKAIDPTDRNFMPVHLKVIEVKGSRVSAETVPASPGGNVLINLEDMEPGDKPNTWLYYMRRQEAASSNEGTMKNRKNTAAASDAVADETTDASVKVLIDEPAQKLANRIYKQFVSETDFTSYPIFVMRFDQLLFEFRGNKPITADEVEEFAEGLEEDTDDGDLEDEVNQPNVVQASAIMTTLASILGGRTPELAFDGVMPDAIMSELKNYALRNGFKPNTLPPNSDAVQALMSMVKTCTKDRTVYFFVFKLDNDQLVITRQVDRGRTAGKPRNLVCSTPKQVLSQGRKIIDTYKNW